MMQEDTMKQVYERLLAEIPNYKAFLTARELGISPTTLWRKMKKYNLLDRRF